MDRGVLGHIEVAEQCQCVQDLSLVKGSNARGMGKFFFSFQMSFCLTSFTLIENVTYISKIY